VAGEEYWSALVAEVDDMIWQAVRAGFDYFQREAGYTRTGSHNTRVHGRETGQWHEADLVVAHWLQHTSRDGDMQLHVHSQIAHTAPTVIDGKWRAPDSLGYNGHVGAVAAIVSQHLEEALTCRFGVAWEARDDGHGFEIKGISGQMMRLFSSRRESITADLRDRAAQFERRVGRKPSQRELAWLAQASNFKTRAAKTQTLDFTQVHSGWADKLARTIGVSLASVAPSVWHDGSGGHECVRPRGPDDPGPVSSQLEVSRAAQKALALAQQGKRTWTRADLIKYRAGCFSVPAWTRPRPPPCSRTWRTGRWPRSSRRWPAWRRPSRYRFRPVCCAPMGAASTSGTAACGSPRTRS
jgi:conjugative relaxase-like TrwC/TraI family protein